MSTLSEHFSLTKRRSNQTYYVGYYRNGKRHWKSTGVSTLPEAYKAMTALKQLFQERQKYTSLSQFIERFLEFSRANHRKRTVELFEQTLGHFQRLAGDVSILEVGAELFDRYKTARMRSKTTHKKNPRNRSPISVNVELNMLRAAFGTAKRWGLIEHNPFVECVLCPIPERTPAFFSLEDFEKLLSCIGEPWLRDIVLFGALTGMRRGEILNLHWAEVDLVRRVVNIESSASFRVKAGKRRTVPLNEAAVALLRSRQGLSTAEHVFTKGDRPVAGDTLTHAFKKAVLRAKLPGPLHYHSLRHSFASWLVQRGATLYEVQALLGHSTSAMTEVYAHLQPSQMHEAVNRLDAALN